MSSIRKRPDRPKPWEARWRVPDGHTRSRSFARKVDAQRFLTTMGADQLRGSYVDPAAGKVTFREFADSWLAAQTFEESTREAVRSRLQHVTFADMELRAVRPSVVQAWVRDRQTKSAPASVRVALANVSAIFGAAVEDGLLIRNPCAARSVRAPAPTRERIVPWTREETEAVIAAHPERYRALPLVCAGLGLRQGEAFGLRVEDVDFLGRRVLVRRQVKIVGSVLVYAPPKGGRSREVPLPDVVAYALSEHLRTHGAQTVTLPWREPGGAPTEAELVFTTRERKPLNRTYYNPRVWKPALKAAGREPTRANGMHALRHRFASVLLEGGVSIRALAEYLGHADPGFTLRTYTHLLPESEDRARQVVDAAFSRGPGVGQEAL